MQAFNIEEWKRLINALFEKGQGSIKELDDLLQQTVQNKKDYYITILETGGYIRYGLEKKGDRYYGSWSIKPKLKKVYRMLKNSLNSCK